ncbi:peroxisomal membrane protein 2-like [Eriocheir sinensis]|uniref:peroxisomal membrane protein 2-like n=1 Tax=Eriocheir sinensis TaxID=95602 RepID=UPI0021C7D574|nr:peroxisomal membrane protein 2-like [Eriocheir sinensis]XP_050739841.1 peroxisomal membrane protein 2-like [Eriocheir sinensis]XP_050739842.1 peroxisomal membrane protein 2-like [Eriocheir sinensis]XP_050739843.1 peroxisomal membrane protein 2-like [Eriocheir sinensis]XP_050739844.1 peroxisomal membrane protein 2-like [Eriocheir sinensis]XP_050739845.1 peroxisomal membrane protein 2-like [Eriocheir sinensis]XP_050739846.1 peroxisomal membrane protein 2-like [Eriocheir sinensis]
MAALMLLQKGLVSYNESLSTRPLVTKACTSAVTTGLGDLLGQVIARQHRINLHSIARHATFGLLVTGPLAHHFYSLLDRWVPPGGKGAALKRLLLDRLGFAPLLLVLYLYLLARMEGKSHRSAQGETRHKIWPALKMNWKVWTPIQFINVNYIPQKYRSLFGNVVALFWVMYITNKRRQAAKKD